jgi:hypothetical protein
MPGARTVFLGSCYFLCYLPVIPLLFEDRGLNFVCFQNIGSKAPAFFLLFTGKNRELDCTL